MFEHGCRYDNSYENLGNHNSWIWYGTRSVVAFTYISPAVLIRVSQVGSSKHGAESPCEAVHNRRRYPRPAHHPLSKIQAVLPRSRLRFLHNLYGHHANLFGTRQSSTPKSDPRDSDEQKAISRIHGLFYERQIMGTISCAWRKGPWMCWE